MGIGNRVVEEAEKFNIGDYVHILPDKGYGIISHITDDGFIFLDNITSRPYLYLQLEKVNEIPVGYTPCFIASKESWDYQTLKDARSGKDFFIGLMFALSAEFVIFTWIGMLLYILFRS